MKIRQDDQDSLRIEDFPWLIGLFAWSLALVLSGRLVYVLIEGTYAKNDLVGLPIGVLVCLFGGNAFAKRSTFVFDRGRRRFIWDRRSLLGDRKGGETTFDDIEDVKVETRHFAQNQKPSHRVTVVAGGQSIPQTESYSLGSEEECQAIVARIRDVVGVQADQS